MSLRFPPILGSVGRAAILAIAAAAGGPVPPPDPAGVPADDGVPVEELVLELVDVAAADADEPVPVPADTEGAGAGVEAGAGFAAGLANNLLAEVLVEGPVVGVPSSSSAIELNGTEVLLLPVD